MKLEDAEFVSKGELRIWNTRRGKYNLPGICARLQEEGDVSGRDIEGGHADDEANHSDHDGSSDVPELNPGRTELASPKREANGGNERLTFSCVRSECQALMRDTMHENTHGGELMSRVGT